MSLASRLGRLETLASPRRLVLVGPREGPMDEPPGIYPHDNGNVTLVVPLEFEGDPMAGLTDQQRREIGPGDRVLILSCGEPDEEPEP